MNAGLGNRAPLLGPGRFESCAWCKDHRNEVVKLNESHVVYKCEGLSDVRYRIGLEELLTEAESMVGTDQFEVYRVLMTKVAHRSLQIKIDLTHMLAQILDAYLDLMGQ